MDERLRNERRKDHYSHYILRLAFSGTEDLRRRFSRVETMLFKLRFQADDGKERRAFVDSLNLSWEQVQEEEKRELGEQLLSATPGLRRLEDENWFKVDWTRVLELVEHRTVLVRKGKAYVPLREQTSMVLTEFTTRLEKGLNSPPEPFHDSMKMIASLPFSPTFPRTSRPPMLDSQSRTRPLRVHQ